MKKRTDLLNFLAEKYNLQRYLEIGVQNPAQNFDKIVCKHKTSVDPDPNAKAMFQMDSDQFFRVFSKKMLKDLIFIDGLHTAEQVGIDFMNSLKILSPNGFIVLHDCNPEKEEHTIVPRPTKTGHWNGSCYKFAIAFEGIKHCVDIDNGCMVIPNQKTWGMNMPLKYHDWEYFDKNRKDLLNLISWNEFIASHP